MTDNDNKSRQGVRRFGRKDRKDKIEVSPLTFPPEVAATPSSAPPAPVFAAPDEPEPPLDDFLSLDELPLPDRDAEALAALSSLPPDGVRPLVVTPDAERFPPVAPTVETSYQPKLSQLPVEPPKNNLKYNVMTFVFGIGTVIVLVYYLIIGVNPQSPLNLFPPPTPFEVVTATPGAPAIISTQPPPVFQTPTLSAASEYPYTIAPTGVLYVANANGRGCEWASIAGTVTGLQGEARDGLGIQIVGNGLDERVFSGATQTFGPGGFELFLGGAPQATEYTVTLTSAVGVPLSEPFTVTTRADCNGNVAIITFVQARDF